MASIDDVVMRLRAAEARPFTAPPICTRQIAVIGGGGTKDLAPYTDPDVECWTMNHLGYDVVRWDRLFQIHGQRAEDDVVYYASLAGERLRPIYMVAALPSVPCSVPFPLAEVLHFLAWRCPKLQRRPYVQSTAAYMVALAAQAIVRQRAQEFAPEPGEWIGVYGVDVQEGEGYEHQRANLEFVLGVAVGLGIAVEVPDGSELLHSDAWPAGLYGGFAGGEG